MRLTLLTCLTIAVAIPAIAQDPTPVTIPQNSIGALVAQQPPVLQDGYASDGDVWMLYDWRFDLLSNGAQQFLLEKYGYSNAGPGAESDAVKATVRNARPAAAAAPPAPGFNIPVSQTFFRVGRRLQSETTIAVNGSNILVGFNDGDLRSQPVAYSTDSGATWSGGRVPFFPDIVGASGDPVLAVGPGGRVYQAYLAANALGFLAIAVAYSDDSGATWNGPTNASASLGGNGSSLDKPWLTADNIAGSPYRGNVYAVCTRFVPNGQDSIVFMRSLDGGRTFSAALPLTTLSAADASANQPAQGAFIAVGPSGEVYVAWYDTRVNGIRLVKSTDGGNTFSAPVTVLTGIGFASSDYLPGTFDVAPFPQIGVDTGSGPNRGAVYVTVDVVKPFRTDMDVLLTHSGDGGTTWDPPVTVNNDGTATDQFQPSIAVAANGNIGVAFYDRRNDPNNVLTDLYLAISSDGGKTFPVQQRVTTESSLILPTPIGYRVGYHGDYNQTVASGNNFYLSWADDRDGTEPSVFAAIVPVTGGLPDFTLTPAKSSADIVAGGSASFPIAASAKGVNLSAAVWPPSGLTVQVSPTAVTAASTAATSSGTYTITVTGDNGSIQRSTELRVTVHPAQLTNAPAPLTVTTDPSYSSASFLDSKGTLHVVYTGTVVGRNPKRISYIQIPANGTPSVPYTIYAANTNSTVDTVGYPQVAVGPDGTIYAVWQYDDPDVDSVMMKISRDNGKTFSEVVDLTSRSEVLQNVETYVHAFYPSIAVAPNGTVYVTYLRENLTRQYPSLLGTLVGLRVDIGLIKSTDGGNTFSSPATAIRYPSGPTPSLSTASPPVLGLDSAGNPYFVWAALTPGRGTDIYLGRSRDAGATFDPAVNVSGYQNTAITPRQPVLAVGPNDGISVAWNAVDGTTGLGDNWLAFAADGQKFSPAVNVSNATYYTGAVSDWPSLAVDSSGNVIAVWREWIDAPYRNNDTERDIFVTRCAPAGGSCGTPVNISSSVGDSLLGAGARLPQRPAVAVDANGKAYVFYDDDTAGSTQVMMWSSPPGFSSSR